MAIFVLVTAAWDIADRRRQRRLAATRCPIDSDEFGRRLAETGVDESVADFVWREFESYYFAPLTPYPEDRPISEMRIDSDDLSDMAVKFEKEFGRRWIGEWAGPDDPTLTEFATGLLASASEK